MSHDEDTVYTYIFQELLYHFLDPSRFNGMDVAMNNHLRGPIRAEFPTRGPVLYVLW